MAHQIINTGTNAMRYLALSNVVEIETCEYPDSKKFMIGSGRRGEPGLWKMFRSENTRLVTPGDEWLGLRRALWPECLDDEHMSEMAVFSAHPDRFVQFLARNSAGEAIGLAEVPGARRRRERDQNFADRLPAMMRSDSRRGSEWSAFARSCPGLPTMRLGRATTSPETAGLTDRSLECVVVR